MTFVKTDIGMAFKRDNWKQTDGFKRRISVDMNDERWWEHVPAPIRGLTRRHFAVEKDTAETYLKLKDSTVSRRYNRVSFQLSFDPFFWVGFETILDSFRENKNCINLFKDSFTKSISVNLTKPTLIKIKGWMLDFRFYLFPWLL